MNRHPIYTLGHSTRSVGEFTSLLKACGATAIADVRSVPASNFNPQYNRYALSSSLAALGIAYVFMGKELGARSQDPTCYVDGKVSYERLAQQPGFKRGIERLWSGSAQQHIVVLCAERDPLACHRTILVSRHLVQRGLQVFHIIDEQHVEAHQNSIMRLREQFDLVESDLFHNQLELENLALELQEERIAYVSPDRKLSQTGPL